MLYAALGDSISYGYDATTEEAGYVRRLAKLLGGKQAVNLYLHAKPGWTSKQLLKSLPKVPVCIWGEARLVTVLVGGNDLLRAAPWLLNGSEKHVLKVAQNVHDNLEKIVVTVKRPQSKVIVGTLYNPFPNSLLAEEYTDVVNKSIMRIALRHRLNVVDVRKLFQHREQQWIDGYRRGQLRDMRFRRNPIHPNDAGHQAIAEAFLRVYRRSLTKQREQRRKNGRRVSPRFDRSAAKTVWTAT